MNRKAILSGIIVLMIFFFSCGGVWSDTNGETQTGNMEGQTENRTETQSHTTESAGGIEQTQEETSSETEAVPQPEVTEIVISAVGDVMLGINQKTAYSRSFHEYYDKYGEDYFFQNVKGVFEEDDFTIVNLEGTLTDSDNIRTTKQWNHKGKPEYVDILVNASVEAVTLGNNHIMDYQQEGVNDTIQTVKDAGLAYGLSGDWGHALGIYEVKGIKIGFVSVNEYYDGDRVYQWLEDGLEDLKSQGADIVIAAMHWGGDKVHELEENQYIMGKWCIDRGFDLVLGCHPHVLQGIEKYNGKYIVYSMGNFCYGGSKNPAEKESMIFQIKFSFAEGVMQEETEAKIIPCRLSSVTNQNDYCPVILEGEEAQKVIAQMNGYSEEFGVVIDEEGNIN